MGCHATESSPLKLPAYSGNCIVNDTVYAHTAIALGLLASLSDLVLGKWPRRYLNKWLHTFAGQLQPQEFTVVSPNVHGLNI